MDDIEIKHPEYVAQIDPFSLVCAVRYRSFYITKGCACKSRRCVA